MRFKLDPTSLTGISAVVETVVKQRQSHGFITDKISGLLTAGTNVTVTGQGTKDNPYIINSSGSSGISRVIATITTTFTGEAEAGTDYVYYLGAGADYTQPTAVGNTSRYSIKNIDTVNKLISFTGAETADNSTTIDLNPDASVGLFSDTANWRII